MRERWRSILRIALLLSALSTYLVVPDDVVWHFIKGTAHARVLEHVFFGVTAVFLGIALLLKMQASVSTPQGENPSTCHTASFFSNVLEATGIGSLFPLHGFLLFVVGNVGISLLFDGQHSTVTMARRMSPVVADTRTWKDALLKHIDLCGALLSMFVFSIVLIDRVADVLFGVTAFVSVAAILRQTVRSRIPSPAKRE